MTSKEEFSEVTYRPFIEIDPELRSACPELRLGIISAEVVVEKRNDAVWDILQKAGNTVLNKYTLNSLTSDSRLQAARDTYRRLGKDPARYRISSEALMRRVLQGKGLYQINNLVDINNILSLESSLAAGAYDLGQIKGAIGFRVGKAGESYKGIGKEMINIADIPVFTDEEGPFGSPTSDSEKAMIAAKTANAMIVLISFSEDTESHIESHLERGKALLKNYAQGTNITSNIC